MEIREQLRKVLAIIAEKADNNINTSVLDTAVIDSIGLSKEEVHRYLNELQSLDLIRKSIKHHGAYIWIRTCKEITRMF
jgi:DNA-binding IclR family transcriptional regulator